MGKCGVAYGRADSPVGAALHSDVGVDRGLGELWVVSMGDVVIGGWFGLLW